MVFQNSWVAKLPWAEASMGSNGRLTQVCYKICIVIEKQKKLLVLKFDNLQKHIGHQKSKHPCSLVVGELYVNTNNQHAKNEIFFVVMHGHENVIQQVVKDFATKQKHKCI